jgi:polyphenol oxidase
MTRENRLREIHAHRFRNLSQLGDLTHGVFTRHGGVSRPPYASLNTAWTNGDSPQAVQENLLRIKEKMGLTRLIGSPQVHGDTIHLIDEATLDGLTSRHPTLFAPPGDALVTRLRSVGLLVKVADCQAIFLVDPVRKVIANIHCGWRGSVQNLARKTVRFLQDRFDCRPRDLLAAISPSLGPCCAEFVNYERELPEPFREFQHKPDYFDFWAITRRQLMDAGLKGEQIECAERCTVCETRNFFSYRGERTTGRNAAVLAWK